MYPLVVGGVEMSFSEDNRDFPEIFHGEVYFFWLNYYEAILLS